MYVHWGRVAIRKQALSPGQLPVHPLFHSSASGLSVPPVQGTKEKLKILSLSCHQISSIFCHSSCFTLQSNSLVPYSLELKPLLHATTQHGMSSTSSQPATPQCDQVPFQVPTQEPSQPISQPVPNCEIQYLPRFQPRYHSRQVPIQPPH